MAVVIINDKPVDIGAERLNLVQAAQKAGVKILTGSIDEIFSTGFSCDLEFNVVHIDRDCTGATKSCG